ncbi:BRCT domain-containing protein At4g02110-like isoform X1 [Nicotiana tabacum]|uniref:BRCT domain-containing protein At4g02110-like isoform X1 n=2 Tax=Nicotiana tabacum TaxID=4097 RepID=A0A1S3XM57_TOBAC|nr:PREDICTED: BRCT domain-containing protein At4g02110-like isoform X1 [Nicotiana tabacum]
MAEINQDMLHGDFSRIFIGVRFVLSGFDSLRKEQIRSKLLEGGGVDAREYGPDCTHLIVDRIVYDDPICVAARRDGKVLVTSLWVEHSFDVGMAVDHLSMMYRPLRDLNGIPGAKSLILCLTGYQRQDRDDIMTMVGLMGANFSKPLVSHKVTHLICYKFEGEKYELAKKLKRIKLVNHRWLEDCLRAWEILPEAAYDKSGYELEMVEAEAKDSEDEQDGIAANTGGERVSFTSPQHSKSPSQFCLKQEICRNISEIHTPTGLADLGNHDQLVLCASKESKVDLVTAFEESHKSHLETLGTTLSRNKEVPHSTPLNGNSPASVSTSAKKSPNSCLSNSCIKSYSRKKPRKIGLASEQIESAGCPPINEVSKHCDVNISSEKEQDGTELFSAEKDQSGLLPGKRRVDMLYSSSNSSRTSHNPVSMLDRGLVEDRGIGLGRHLLLGKNVHSENGARLDPSQNCDSSISNPIKLGNQQECDEDALQAGTCAVRGLKEITLSSNVDPVNFQLCETKDSTVELNGLRNELQAAKNPSPGNESEDIEKSSRLAELENAVGDSTSGSKPLKRKSLSKKTLGSRQSLCKGDSRNQKGTISLNKIVPANESAPSVSGGIKNTEHQEVLSCEKVEVPPADTAESNKETEKRKYFDSGNEDIKTAESINRDAETPENKEYDELNVARAELGGAPHSGVNSTEKNPAVNQLVNRTDVEDCAVRHDSDNKSSKAQKTISRKKTRSNKSTSVENDVDVKETKGPKYLMKRSRTTNLAAKRAVVSTEVAKRKKSKSETKKNAELGKGKGLPVTGKATLAPDHELNSMDAEKENEPAIGGQHTTYIEQGAGETSPKCKIKPLKADVANPDALQVTKLGTERRWFILSGHRLQRKEFEKVIKRLKGNVCRDSHQWSYQATHFIVPDPVRRTEKFLAAAASGRWILKTDYLTASNEAGRLLDEEQYEWHKKGLTEDLAIDLEAPRKWRLLSERTGHGAFYGMKIIIYGDCIVPPLDTLKRAVKAGDGTILATSPPYTRFLKSGVDFAIVDETMPHYDKWIQEFLRHEIPCVLPDYLVAYVCKPGYPRDSYVKYNTHTWVERSLKNLADRLEEVVEGIVLSDDNSNM